MTGVAKPPGFVKPIYDIGIHKKGGNANDSIRNYFDIHWNISFANILWWPDDSGSHLSQ